MFLHKTFCSLLFVSESECCCDVVAEKPGAAPPLAEAPAAAQAKKLDNLFFVEEPKPAHVTESETHEWRLFTSWF